MVFATAALTAAAAPLPADAGPTLDAVKARGAVVCGVGSRPGFSALNSRGEWEGMDVDTCKAIAAAVLGDKEKVKFVSTTTQTRFPALQTGEIDVLTRNVTWTLTRDTKVALDFPVITFYDGQGFMVPKALGVKSAKELNGVSVCLLPGTTSEKVAGDFFRSHKLSYKPLIIETQKELNAAFFSGRCDAHMQSTSGLSSTRAANAPKPDDYVILPEIMGKDPMGPVVRQGDSQWKEIVAWSVYAMIEAEEIGVSSKNVDELLKSPAPEIKRLLGVTPGFGEALGLDEQWAYRILKQVGNYGEVYDRNVGKDSPLKLERVLNRLWKDGGLIYSPPFN
jgi:general L-amino acid transport system substrate-binding protein